MVALENLGFALFPAGTTLSFNDPDLPAHLLRMLRTIAASGSLVG